MNDILHIYKLLAKISYRMLDAVENGRFDDLEKLESLCRSYIGNIPQQIDVNAVNPESVSYTHLTLPTKRIV